MRRINTFNAGFLPIPFAIAPSTDLAFPYIVILLGVIIAVSALVIIFPSLRKFRRKRNILIYTITFLIIAVLIFQIYDVPKRAVISYSFAGDTEYYDREGDQILITCQNYGDKAASFYIIVSSVNASFQNQTQQNYIQTSSRTIKVPFMLQESWLSANAESKTVFFTIDENVTGFSFSFSFENQSHAPLIVASGDTNVEYAWESTENCYMQGTISRFT